MKPWKTSSATNDTRSARPSFRLDSQWSGYGPILPQRGLTAATKLEDWVDYAIRSDCAPYSLAQFDNLAQKTRLSRLVVQGTSRKPENRPGSRGLAICSLPDFPEFAQAVRYGVPGTQ